MARRFKVTCDLCGVEIDADVDTSENDDPIFEQFGSVIPETTKIVQGIREHATRKSEDICEACYSKITIDALCAIKGARERIIFNSNMNVRAA